MMTSMEHWKSPGLRRLVRMVTGLLLTGPATALACPSCKNAIEGDPVAAAFNSTTLLMIAVPVILVGSAGGWIFYASWRARRALDERTVPPHGASRPFWTEKESEA